MSVSKKRYRQTKYSDIYEIEFHSQSDGTIKMFCFEHPHNRHETEVGKCHLYSSGEICVAAGCEPRSLDRAIAIAIFWMDGYSHYVRTGEFYNGKAKVNV